MDSPKMHFIISLLAFILGIGLVCATQSSFLIKLGIFVFLVQWVFYVPAIFLKTEAFYDLVGTLSFFTGTLGVLFAAQLKYGFRFYDLIAALCIILWTLRLGVFLVKRVKQYGDGRFDEIKVSRSKFFMSWTLQGMWVVFCATCIWTAILSPTGVKLSVLSLSGGLIFLLGFFIETLADYQKTKFKNASQFHKESRFISHGLWRYSRHPNYFGEVMVWLGLSIMAYPSLNGVQYMTLIAPLFTYLLLRYVSGVPILEERADKKWGHLESYKTYKKNTPVLFPKF